MGFNSEMILGLFIIPIGIILLGFLAWMRFHHYSLSFFSAGRSTSLKTPQVRVFLLRRLDPCPRKVKLLSSKFTYKNPNYKRHL